MSKALAPTLEQPVGGFHLLWFETSNQYLVVDTALYELLQHFLAVDTPKAFDRLVNRRAQGVDTGMLYQDLASVLEQAHHTPTKAPLPSLNYQTKPHCITHYYRIGPKVFEVHYDSEAIQQLLHPKLSHYSLKHPPERTNVVLDLYQSADQYCLFKDGVLLGTYSPEAPHVLQGEFGMALLCSLHDNEEMDWLGVFHASTVVKADRAVLLIGNSGMGKSTFTALLHAHNYTILADDMAPMLFKDRLLYAYPSGISIKSGAFDLLNTHIKGFKALDSHYISPYKGTVKYVNPDPRHRLDYQRGYACRTMVQIQYQKDHPTILEPLALDTALHTLIPESWLAPKESHAQAFLDWIKTVRFYSLTYSDHEAALIKFSECFE